MAEDNKQIKELGELRAPSRTAHERQAFHAQILAQVGPPLARRRRPRTWDVLARWARPGLAAAAVAFALLLAALQFGPDRHRSTAPLGLEERLAAGSESTRVPAWLVGLNEPDADAVIAAALLQTNLNAGESR